MLLRVSLTVSTMSYRTPNDSSAQLDPHALALELTRKANRIQVMGILAMLFALACPLIGLSLSGVALVMSAGAIPAARQLGLVQATDRLATGKTCSLLSLGLAMINGICGVIIAAMEVIHK